MRISRSVALALMVLPAPAQNAPEPERVRIVTAAEVENATHPRALWLLRVVSFPHRSLTAGMEKGLIAFERHKIRERYNQFTEDLRRHGLEYRFGGSGEGAGLGGGGKYTVRTGERHALESLGLVTLKNYQEFDLQWKVTLPHAALVAEGSYQWRPQENFYGLGHDTSRQKHSNFALRQTWSGIRWEVTAPRRLRWGVLHRWAWLRALAGHNPLYATPGVYFRDLAGYGAGTRLRSTGAYLDMDGIRGEYQLGGAAHFGASYQDGMGPSRLSYFSYEMQLEGRMPVLSPGSAFVGQANFQLNRARGGSDPIPFYLLPHIGGSSTLRGFALDRFYGKNVALLSLEYRYGIHPNIQAVPFFDEGQIFDRTADLTWLNWHRNYGFGLRFHRAGATALRVEYGRSSEGFQVHLIFGDRERPPLQGPFRYGVYKR